MQQEAGWSLFPQKPIAAKSLSPDGPPKTQYHATISAVGDGAIQP
jgi:hypothetical protein